jgi:hypothetical protein
VSWKSERGQGCLNLVAHSLYYVAYKPAVSSMVLSGKADLSPGFDLLARIIKLQHVGDGHLQQNRTL